VIRPSTSTARYLRTNAVTLSSAETDTEQKPKQKQQQKKGGGKGKQDENKLTPQGEDFSK
jgi:hypothetical protein